MAGRARMHPWNLPSTPLPVLAAFILTVLSTGSAARAQADSATLRESLAWQIALERVGYSPGLIDGKIGPKTELATREFQRVRGLPVTGRLDDATSAALAPKPDAAIATYCILSADLDQVGALPKDWTSKSKLSRLPYPSLDEVLAEKFHCTRDLLARLNPGRTVAQLRAGDELAVPAIAETSPTDRGEALEISLSQKVIRVLDRENRLVSLFHCSIAADKAKRPSGTTRIAVITQNPTYVFDPAMWPEVTDVDRKLLIPPGPRNPVGRCWIGLALPGYGIHGSPSPEMIGKTGSHGCFRLTNWDALRLAKLVRVGTPVRFTDDEAQLAER